MNTTGFDNKRSHAVLEYASLRTKSISKTVVEYNRLIRPVILIQS